MNCITNLKTSRNILLAIIIVAISLRILGLNSAFVSDENEWVRNVIIMHSGIFKPTLVVPHPPLAVLSYFVITSVLGTEIYSFRLLPFIVGILAIITTYKFGLEIYSKKTSLLITSLMATTFYPVWASLYVDVDGNFLMLFTLLTIFSYFKFNRTREKKFLFLTSLFLGLAMLSKYPAIVIPFILIIFDLSENRLKNIKSLLIIFILAGLIFSIFPFSAYIIGDPDIFLQTLGWGSTNFADRFITTSSLSDLAISSVKTINFLLSYGLPFAALLSLTAIFWKRRKSESIVIVYFLVFIIFYTFIFLEGVKLRYLMIIVPPLYILSGRVIADLLEAVNKKDILFLAASMLIFSILVSGLNTYGSTENFNSQTASIEGITKNAFFWYSGHGSSPFAIHIQSYLFVSGLSFVLFLILLATKNQKNKKLLTILLLSLNIVFNFFILFQSFIPTVGPDYSSTFREMLTYINNAELEKPIFSPTQGFSLFSNKEISKISMEQQEYDINGSIIFMDVQTFGNPQTFSFESYLKTKCKEEKVFFSNGHRFGYIFQC